MFARSGKIWNNPSYCEMAKPKTKSGSAKKQKQKRKRTEKELASLKIRRKLDESEEIQKSDSDNSYLDKHDSVSDDSLCFSQLENNASYVLPPVNNSETLISMSSVVKDALDTVYPSGETPPNMPTKGLTTQLVHNSNQSSSTPVNMSSVTHQRHLQTLTSQPSKPTPMFTPTHMHDVLARLISIESRLPPVPSENLSQELAQLELSAIVSTVNGLKSSIDYLTSEIKSLREENALLKSTVTSQESCACSSRPSRMNSAISPIHRPAIPTNMQISTGVGLPMEEHCPSDLNVHASTNLQRQVQNSPNNQPVKSLIIGGSTLKHFSPNRLTTPACMTKVQTHRGATVGDVTKKMLDFPGLEESTNIVLHAGTNNIGRQPDTQILGEYHEFIEQTRQYVPQCRITISSILPRPNDPAANVQIINVNNSLRDLCASNHVNFVDNTPCFLNHASNTPNKDLFEDNIHIGMNGTRVLAKAICDAIGISQYIDPSMWQLRTGPDQKTFFPQRRYPGREQNQQSARFMNRQPQPRSRSVPFNQPQYQTYHQQQEPVYMPLPHLQLQNFSGMNPEQWY